MSVFYKGRSYFVVRFLTLIYTKFLVYVCNWQTVFVGVPWSFRTHERDSGVDDTEVPRPHRGESSASLVARTLLGTHGWTHGFRTTLTSKFIFIFTMMNFCLNKSGKWFSLWASHVCVTQRVKKIDDTLMFPCHRRDNTRLDKKWTTTNYIFVFGLFRFNLSTIVISVVWNDYCYRFTTKNGYVGVKRGFCL